VKYSLGMIFGSAITFASVVLGGSNTAATLVDGIRYGGIACMLVCALAGIEIAADIVLQWKRATKR
jgi:hypothetical protein